MIHHTQYILSINVLQSDGILKKQLLYMDKMQRFRVMVMDACR